MHAIMWQQKQPRPVLGREARGAETWRLALVYEAPEREQAASERVPW